MVANQDIDFAKPVDRLCDEWPRRIAVDQIRLQPNATGRASAFLLQALSVILSSLVTKHDTRARRDEHTDNSGANTARPAGYNGNPLLE